MIKILLVRTSNNILLTHPILHDAFIEPIASLEILHFRMSKLFISG